MTDISNLSGGRQYMARNLSVYTKRLEQRQAEGKVPWYEKDMSAGEIKSNNASAGNREGEGADLCRKLADIYRSSAEANRAKFTTVGEMVNSVFAKYNSQYSNYSRNEREAMARNEINMTLYGDVHYGYDVMRDPHIHGEVTKNKLRGDDEEGKRAFNAKTLATQLGNVFTNNGLNPSLINQGNYRFTVDCVSKRIVVSALDDKSTDSSLLKKMTDALNTNDNGKNLFYNLLYDGSKQGIHPKDSMAKFRLYNDFMDVAGYSMEDFIQTDKGFFDSNGRNVIDIFTESLKSYAKIRSEFKGIANDYFKSLVDDAMKYKMSDTPDLTVSMEYREGQVFLNGGERHFDTKA